MTEISCICGRTYYLIDGYQNYKKAKCICGEYIELYATFDGPTRGSKDFKLLLKNKDNPAYYYKMSGEHLMQAEWEAMIGRENIKSLSSAEKWLNENNIRYKIVENIYSSENIIINFDHPENNYEDDGCLIYFENPGDLIYFKLSWH